MTSIRIAVVPRILFVVVLLSLPSSARADVTLPALFADHMVVQRQLPVHVWGMADSGEAVTVSFRGESQAATADHLGRWSLYLPPGEAGGPFEITVQGHNKSILRDVLVGDVWVASGQSNMEFEMYKVANATTEIAAAGYPNIRLLKVAKSFSDYRMDDAKLAASWVDCTPESVHDFSAVAYFFARDVQKKENVPIGLIESSWGGTPAEAWTSLRALSTDAGLMPVFAARATMTDNEPTTLLQQQEEEREIEQAKVAGRPTPEFPWHPDPNSWGPGNLYNAMITPLTPFPIRGVIWYQGEANSGLARAPLYGRVLQTLIQDWRNNWAEGDFPFLFVQISNFKSNATEDWPEAREGQRSALALRNTAMVVTIDIGNPDDVHPMNKQDVGARLALAARAVAYGEVLEYSGPLYRQTTTEDHALKVWFTHAESGLQAKGGALRGFEIAGEDGKYVPAQARIEGSSVVVSSGAVSTPVYVRYGWANSPDCNLYNKQGLPASPFRSSP
jgi:sialate O-acetylesterase